MLVGNLRANELQQGLVRVILHADQLAQHWQIKPVSLAFGCPSIEDIANAESHAYNL